MNLFKAFVIQAVLLMCACAAQGCGLNQPTAPLVLRNGIMAFGQLTARDVNPSGIDAPLADAGLPGMFIPPFALGIGFAGWHHRLGISIDGTFPTVKRMDSTKQKTGSAASIGVSVSYMINDPKRTNSFAFYPFLGIQEVFYRYKSVAVPAHPSKIFSGVCPYADLGLGMDFGAGFIVGLRAGYLLPLSSISWSDNTQPQIITSGQFINRGFYVSLKFGVGLIPGDY